MNNNLLKFSGHKVIGSSSEQNEEEDSSSSIEIDYEKLFEDEFHELVQKAEKKNGDKMKLAVSSKNLGIVQSAFILSTINSM